MPMVKGNCPNIPRSFDDDYTFRMCFSRDKHAIAVPRAPPTVWIMGGTECGGGCGDDGSSAAVIPEPGVASDVREMNPYL